MWQTVHALYIILTNAIYIMCGSVSRMHGVPHIPYRWTYYTGRDDK